MNITKAFLETCGTASLEGALYEEGIVKPQVVLLQFEVSPPTKGGPDILLMPDFAPACLVKSIVNLCEKGYKFKVEQCVTEGRK